MLQQFSIKFERGLVLLRESRVLLFLVKEAIPDSQQFHIGTHKTAESIFRSTDDWLATDVEAGIHDHRTSCALIEATN